MDRNDGGSGGSRGADSKRVVDGRDGTDPDGFDVPPGADAVRCSRCGQPFARDRHLALHRGLDHWSGLTDDEREAFEAARADEEADLRRFRIVALGVLVLVYFGFLFVYALVT
jgi:hypothetical protein